MEIKIYFSEDNEKTEMEAIENKGYRSDIIVTIDGAIYHPEFITPERLSIEAALLEDSFKGYFEKFTTIIVKEVNKETIINTICLLAQTSYFSYFTPYNKKMLIDRGCDDLEKYIQVYPVR